MFLEDDDETLKHMGGFTFIHDSLTQFMCTCWYIQITTSTMHWINNVQQCSVFTVRDSSDGIETRYGLDGPGIESQPIPVDERSKARVFSLLLVGVGGSNSAGDMDVCVVRVAQPAHSGQRSSRDEVKKIPVFPDFPHRPWGPARFL
jgi:hypothetical protein